MKRQSGITAPSKRTNQRNGEPINRPLRNTRELTMVLASLRYWQREGWISDGHEHDLVSDGGTLKPLTMDEINALCERLNMGEPR